MAMKFRVMVLWVGWYPNISLDDATIQKTTTK